MVTVLMLTVIYAVWSRNFSKLFLVFTVYNRNSLVLSMIFTHMWIIRRKVQT